MTGRFVALGDSFTEGVGDWNSARPNGVKGWADRTARQLARQDPEWEYANLAVRSKRLHQIEEQQLDAALALKPTDITFYAGGNDILDVRTDVTQLMRRYEAVVRRMVDSGARVILFTGYDVKVSPILEPLKRRHALYNREVRRIAAELGTDLVDYWALDRYQNRELWGSDRLHMSPSGHKYMASQVLKKFGVDWTPGIDDGEDESPSSILQMLAAERDFMREWVIPLVGRKLRGITLGDLLEPRWPEPIRPAEGMKRLARARMADMAYAAGPGGR